MFYLFPHPWQRTANDTDYSYIPGYLEGAMMWKVWPVLLLVLGSFGNVATILVMRRIKDNNSSQYDILKALAIADMSVLYSGTLFEWIRDTFGVFVPIYHPMLCKVLISMFYASHTVAAWLVVAVTMQRTMAVLWPHRMRVMCTVRRTWAVIAVIVIMTAAFHVPMLIMFDVFDNRFCGVQASYLNFYFYVWPWVDMCIASFLPTVCLFVCDVILSLTLFKSTSISSTAGTAGSDVGTAHSQDSRQKTATRMTGMVLALSFTFMLLTLPLTFLLGLINLFASTEEDYARAYILFSVFSFLWDANSGVNFFLYCLTGTRFRKEFVSMLRCGGAQG